MNGADRQRWERRHATRPVRRGAPLPSVAWIPRARARAVALDVACGSGRHTTVLLEKGYRVVAADLAMAALRNVMTSVRPWAARCSCVHADLRSWPFDTEVFDVIVQCCFLDRELIAKIRRSLRPGGLLLIDTFLAGPSPRGAHAPSHTEFLLRPGELLRRFDDWQILRSAIFRTPAARHAFLVRKPATAR